VRFDNRLVSNKKGDFVQVAKGNVGSRATSAELSKMVRLEKGEKKDNIPQIRSKQKR